MNMKKDKKQLVKLAHAKINFAKSLKKDDVKELSKEFLDYRGNPYMAGALIALTIVTVITIASVNYKKKNYCNCNKKACCGCQCHHKK